MIKMNVMEAGIAAPSGCNKQTTGFIAVDDADVLKRINEAVDPPVCETAPAIARKLCLKEVSNAVFKSVWGNNIKACLWSDEASSEG